MPKINGGIGAADNKLHPINTTHTSKRGGCSNLKSTPSNSPAYNKMDMQTISGYIKNTNPPKKIGYNQIKDLCSKIQDLNKQNDIENDDQVENYDQIIALRNQIEDLLKQSETTADLNDKQKLDLIDKIIEIGSIPYDINDLLNQLSFKQEKSLVSAITKIIKTSYYECDNSAIDYFCKSFNLFSIKNVELRNLIVQSVIDSFPLIAIIHADKLKIQPALIQKIKSNLKIDDIQELSWLLWTFHTRIIFGINDEFHKLIELINHAPDDVHLEYANYELSKDKSKLVLYLDYLNIDDAEKKKLLENIANSPNEIYEYSIFIANCESISPHALLALYQNIFAKYNPAIDFDKLDRNINTNEVALLGIFIKNSAAIFKDDILKNKYAIIIDKLSFEEKLKVIDLFMEYDEHTTLSMFIHYFKFGEKVRINILEKIIEASKNDNSLLLISVMRNIENFEISDLEQNLKFYLNLKHDDVPKIFPEGINFDELVLPLKNMLGKNIHDMNQEFAIKYFSIMLIKTFVDRYKINLGKSTPLLEIYNQFLHDNKELIPPMYEAINNIVRGASLRFPLSQELIKIVQSEKKSQDFYKILELKKPSNNNLLLMLLYNICPDFMISKDRNIERLYALFSSSTTYSSANRFTHIAKLMYELSIADILLNIKQKLLKICLPNNIKDNKPYHNQLCINLMQLQFVISSKSKNKVLKLNSLQELNNLYISCLQKIFPHQDKVKLKQTLNDDNHMKMFGYAASMQNMLGDKEKPLFNENLCKLYDIVIFGNQNDLEKKYHKLKFDKKSSELITHLEKNYPDFLQLWKKEISYKTDKHTFICSHKWEYMLPAMLSGHCLDLGALHGHSTASLAHMTNGQYKIVAQIDNKNGQMTAFYIEMTAIDEKSRKPVIYKHLINVNTKISDEDKQILINFNNQAYRNMGVDIVVESPIKDKDKDKPDVKNIHTLTDYPNHLIVPASTYSSVDFNDGFKLELYNPTKEYTIPSQFKII